MEFEDVSEDLEWEARRIAVAFEAGAFEQKQELFYGPGALGISKGVARWVYPPNQGKPQVSFNALIGETYLGWRLDESAMLRFVFLGNKERVLGARLFFDRDLTNTVWSVHPHILYNHSMMRGLYRLGFDDESMLAELNSPLSAHEKLELRLSMPREFWPKKWLDEEQVGEL